MCGNELECGVEVEALEGAGLAEPPKRIEVHTSPGWFLDGLTNRGIRAVQKHRHHHPDWVHTWVVHHRGVRTLLHPLCLRKLRQGPELRILPFGAQGEQGRTSPRAELLQSFGWVDLVNFPKLSGFTSPSGL